MFSDVVDVGRITGEGIALLDGRQVEAELKIVLPDWVPHAFLNGLSVADNRGFIVTDRGMNRAIRTCWPWATPPR